MIEPLSETKGVKQNKWNENRVVKYCHSWEQTMKFESRLFRFFPLVFLLVLLLSIASIDGQSINHVKSYSGYTVVRVVPRTKIQLEYLRDVEEEMALESSPIEFWKLGCCIDTPSDIMVGPISSYWFMNQLSKIGMEPQILIDDVAEWVLTFN